MYDLCNTVAKADFVPARTAPVTAFLPVALAAPDDGYEMATINGDPPPPYEAPNAAIEPQQERHEPNEPDVEAQDSLIYDVVRHSDASEGTPVESGVAVTAGHA